MGFSGHINVMLFAGTVTGVVRIQTFGAILVGRVVAQGLNICNEHFEVISTMLFAYKAAIQDGGFANGWKGVVMLGKYAIGFLAGLKMCNGEFHCHGCILGDSKIFGIYIIASWVVPLWNV